MSKPHKFRNKEEIKAMFEKERLNIEDYDIKNISQKPEKPGEYTLQIEDVKSIVPLTLDFDGENWNKEQLDFAMNEANGNIEKISYYDKKPIKKLKR